MERGSSKHGPHQDEEMRRQARIYTRGGIAGSRAGDWREAEPAGEDQPQPTWIPGGAYPGGAPAPLTGAEVEARSRLGRWLPRSVLPADRAALRRAAEENRAPEDILDELQRLPADRTFDTILQIWAALGHANEVQRW